MKKNIVIAVLATIVAIFVALLLYGLSLEESSTAQNASSPIKLDEEVKVESLDGFKEVYMSTCNEDGTLKSYCSCTYDYFIANYSIERLMEIGEEYNKTNVISDEMMDAAVACADRI